MNGSGPRLSAAQKRALFSVGGTLLASGSAWAWMQHLDEAGRASETIRELKPWLLKIHGLGAMAFVFLLGTLFAGHVGAAWRARANLANGAAFFASISLLTISGYLLYYIGGEGWREFMSRIHLWVGLATPLLLAWHLRRGKGRVRNGAHDGAAVVGRRSRTSPRQ